jgi:hypothetical protein
VSPSWHDSVYEAIDEVHHTRKTYWSRVWCIRR